MHSNFRSMTAITSSLPTIVNGEDVGSTAKVCDESPRYIVIIQIAYRSSNRSFPLHSRTTRERLLGHVLLGIIGISRNLPPASRLYIRWDLRYFGMDFLDLRVELGRSGMST